MMSKEMSWWVNTVLCLLALYFPIPMIILIVVVNVINKWLATEGNNNE